jgi:hypothetical protein
MFEHLTAVQNAVYIVAGTGNLLMLGCLVAVLLNWNTALIRASSRVFMVLTLVLISVMLCGSVLYAYVPALSESYICHLRPWFTCISIMGVLAGNINSTTVIAMYNLFVSAVDVNVDILFVCCAIVVS